VHTKGNGRRVRTTAIVVGSVLSALALLIFAAAYFLYGAFHENTAQTAVAPLEQRLQLIGGQKLCSVGDAGYGFMNDAPWYRVTYRMPSSTSAKSVFLTEAAKLGYTLVPLKHDYAGKSDVFFNSHPVDGSGLGLEILRDVEFSRACDDLKGAVSGNEGLLTIDAPQVPLTHQ
jgi:hypothetical protein